MSAYEAFASVYDIFMEQIEYDQWLAHIYAVWERFGVNPKTIMDLGCGTGNFLQILENHFDCAIGIDLSESMIKIASQNCKKAKLMVGNILDFNFDQKFDLITCNYDMINHLNSIQEYIIVFKNVFKHLKQGGLFLFDFNTVEYLKNSNYQVNQWEDEETIKTGQDIFIDSNHAMFEIKVYDKKNKLLASINEVESFYDYKTIELALKDAKFDKIIFCDRDLQETKDFSAKRLFVICQK